MLGHKKCGLKASDSEIIYIQYQYEGVFVEIRPSGGVGRLGTQPPQYYII